MFGIRTRLAVVFAAAALALSACSSTGTKDESVGAQNRTLTSTQKATGAPNASPGGNSKAAKTLPAPSAPAGVDSKAAWGDIKLGAIRIDAKLGTPSAEVTITNHSSKRSNYIIDLSIKSTDGKTQFDAAMVSAQDLAPGQTTTRTAHFSIKQQLPTGATLTLVGVARLVP
jgi:hypothetical protein